MERARVGIDLGGTKIELIALSRDDQVLERRRIVTPQGDYGATLAAIAGLVRECESRHGISASVGVGTPGARSRVSGLMKNANSTVLNGRDLAQDLCRALNREVRIANDADCFALSEASDGAATGAECVFGIILGTGVGGGIVVRGALLAGPNAIAGEWGHNPLPWPGVDELAGVRCYCGRDGCLETWLSGPGLSDDAIRRGIRPWPPDARALLARDQRGDLVARATLDAWIDRLARGLASVINLLDPDVIVVGGGLSAIERIYHDVPLAWERWVFSDAVATRLVRNHHGDASGVRGAAWLWPSPGA